MGSRDAQPSMPSARPGFGYERPPTPVQAALTALRAVDGKRINLDELESVAYQLARLIDEQNKLADVDLSDASEMADTVALRIHDEISIDRDAIARADAAENAIDAKIDSRKGGA